MRSSDQALLGAEMLERALQPAVAGSRDAVTDLVSMAGGRRPALEAAASLLVARLHRRSDDFAATRALRSVSDALSRIGWEMPSVPIRRRFWSRRDSNVIDQETGRPSARQVTAKAERQEAGGPLTEGEATGQEG